MPPSTEVIRDVAATPIEATLMSTPQTPANLDSNECCLVQIYPADVVDGMVLIEEESLTAGREESNALCLQDSSVSRRHAELFACQGGYGVRDLGSTNGTLLNGKRVTQAELTSGDTLQIGCYMFKFLLSGSVESHYHETVYSAMTRDALTGAMNKRYLLESLEREVIRSRRQQNTLAAIMIDIDHFKQVNDTHGHLVGDEVLREFGQRVQNACREDDLFARYGGEEFCICLIGTDAAEAVQAAERCRQAVAEAAFETAAGPLAVTASFGLALQSTDPSEGPLDLIRRADEKLYEAKTSGRNCVRR